jgi:malonyl CoA-acyl carrier protein transacylase
MAIFRSKAEHGNATATSVPGVLLPVMWLIQFIAKRLLQQALVVAALDAEKYLDSLS